jgi:hypothetical protein
VNGAEHLSGSLQVKVLCLVLAVVLWAFVSLETPGELDLSVPVTVVNLGAGLVVREPPPATVTLRLAGPRILLMRQHFRSGAIQLDLAGVAPGKITFTALDQKIALVQGVRSLGSRPAVISITLGPTDSPQQQDIR